MNTAAIISILEGLISSVPEAINLFNKLAPLIMAHPDIPIHVANEIEALVGSAHDAVAKAHTAIGDIISTHHSVAL